MQPIAELLAKKATQRTARDRAITDRRELCRTSLGQLAQRQCALPDWQGNQHRQQPPTARHPAPAHPARPAARHAAAAHRGAPGLARLDGSPRPGHQRQPLRARLQPLLAHHPRRRFRLWRGHRAHLPGGRRTGSRLSGRAVEKPL